ncbi:hypothetical protein LUZ60_017031 [Juncus effusus]|nr:hypothetical protein LUZ60_017031 [Juncus effusus]
MAEIAVTGWFISPIIKEMLDKASSYIGSQYNWNKDMEKDLDRLDRTLTEILAMVSTIERRDIKDVNQKKLLNRLKDAVYEAEDVLDGFDYLVLKSKSRDSLNGHGRFSSSCKILCKRLVGVDKFRKSLTGILTRLDEVRTSADCLIKLAGLDNIGLLKRPEIPPSRITKSDVRERKIVGREEELNNVVELLLKVESDENGSSRARLDLVSIIGIGGMGKTTLAQLVYNDTRIRESESFDLRMWVCVSDVFDEIRLTRDILKSISDENYNDVRTLDGLQHILREKLGRMKFLLVLDDVWYDEDMSDWDSKMLWDKVLDPLRNVSKGCKVLITTRMEKVHDLMGVSIFIPLKGLAQDAYWSLFEKHAFCRDDPDEYPELKVIGMSIAERLAGSPLAAKVIGRLLNADLDINRWNKVLHSDISDDIMKVLKLSYQHLPEHLQVCFAFCGLLPKDWYIIPNRLINMWIAQGLVQVPEGSSDNIEEIGNEYFGELVTRSFLEISWLSSSYGMHDLMIDLARYVSKDEYLRINNDRFREIPPTIRHLSIDSSYLDKLSRNKNQLKSLRTLLVVRKSWPCWKGTIEEDVIKRIKSIRVLDLSGCCLDMLPKSIEYMKHLRYLAFKVPEKPLPRSLSKLYHLEVLVVYGHSCRYNEPANIPSSITNLINFRHAFILNVGGAIIPRLGSQARLQGHGEFHVRNEAGQRLGDLKDMNNLNGQLTIKYLENVENEQEAVEAYLYRKESITRLELEWSPIDSTSASNLDSNVLERLRPHAKLEQLSIKGYRGSGLPSWLEDHYLTKLRFLDLENISWLEKMPSLGQLPLLEYLRMKSMNSLKKISSDFYGKGGGIHGFPCLIDLIFGEMPLLEEWERVTQEGQENHLFPNLERFHISNCPLLIDAPVFNSTPKIEIDITSGSLPTLSLVSSLKSSTQYLLLSASSFSFLKEFQDQLIGIEELEIINCSDCLPVEFGGLISLKKLRLKDCASVFLLIEGVDMGIILPSTIDYIEMINCEINTEIMPIYFQNLTSLSTITIRVCNLITSLAIGLEPNNLTNLQVVNIRECEGLISLVGFKNLINLKKLMVLDCKSFCSLPNDLERVCSLNILVICGCPEMKSLPVNGLPNSLEMILLSRCHSDLEKQFQEKEGLEWDKVKNIPEIILKVELIHMTTLFEDCSA